MVLVTFWGHFGVTLVAKWDLRAVFLEIQILMTKKVARELAGVGRTWQDLAGFGRICIGRAESAGPV